MKWLAVVVVALGLVACGDKPATKAKDSGEPPATAIKKATENGPVAITVQVWPAKPTLGDPIHLRLTVVSHAGVAVDLPFQQDGLGRFRVASYTRSERREGEKRVQVQDYVVDAPSSGRHRLPPFRLEMIDRRGAGSGSGTGTGTGSGSTEILTEEIPLEVGAIAADATSATLPAARAPLPADVGGWPWWAWIGIALGVIWIGLGVMLLLRFRARRAVRIKLSAYDAAVARLRALEERGAPEAGDAADAWFVELSSIVRVYLEARYDIRAPELTTEEFLQVASRSGELTDSHRELLSSFMERCDRVKFAGYRPDAEESLATLRAARGFVEDTRLRPDAEAARRVA